MSDPPRQLACAPRDAGSGERTTSAPVIQVHALRKSYGEHEVIRGIDIEVRRGEIYAFLGPNGAGKTTTVEILEGYRSRDGGEVSVLNEDPAHAGSRWRARIGLVLQSCMMPAELTVRELVELYAGYYPHPRPASETIELVGLADKRDARTKQLSGGQLRRLDVALALIGDPDLVFLDEPTTGFDPSARHHAWEVVANLRALGKTIFLTTHYMDEAQALADHVAVIVAGQIVAQGTPATLGAATTPSATSPSPCPRPRPPPSSRPSSLRLLDSATTVASTSARASPRERCTSSPGGRWRAANRCAT
ncbi:MAG TPA: ABC transporter ATP-binding protein [Solirubrobacteraceae bacterium]|nr:ABC transporter ATP-binding protein [Solirubrobacteraceae bacterium]